MSNRQLRIAMVAPPWFDLPPRGYGGIEAMCADLVDALVARGHQVTLIAAGRNGTRARMVRTYDVPQGPRLGEPLPEVLHAAAAGRILDGLEVDVVHDHSLAGPLLARGRSVPTVVTVHGPVAGEPGEYYRQLGDSVHLVAISDAQRRTAPELNWCGTVHNALRPEDSPYRPDKEDWVLFLGRCTPDKGMHLAIDAARAAGREIRLAAKCSEPAEREYFEAEIRPRLGEGVEWLGEVGGVRKKELLARARCLLFPLQWEEPFGMVMIEAMACGTPVVTLRRGSVPEVVEDGATGLVRDDPAELPEAVRAVDRLDPARCRKSVVERFRPEIMAAGYEAVYLRAVAARGGAPGDVPPEPDGSSPAGAAAADMLPVA
ncbi:glycosyltransferase family 4 protein [Streptomyces sp. URMC 125]|uniref:glycosyltransferase family 4 protein n=1 Tax=Streptomyces sp. URMC 125 TaxID=3423419 RepID=UPI003F19E91D